MITSFVLENIDRESPNLHLKEFLYGPTYPLNFVVLALTRAEIAWGGGQILPPFSRARNSQTLPREHVKTFVLPTCGLLYVIRQLISYYGGNIMMAADQ